MRKIIALCVLTGVAFISPLSAHDGEDHGETSVGAALETNLEVGAPGVNTHLNADAEVSAGASSTEGEPANDAHEEEGSQSRGHNESDLEFLQESAISVRAANVRGWDADKKAEFLATIKSHAEVQSEQDLENFATGVLLRDENVASVHADRERVIVSYRVPAKFLGIFSTTVPVTVTVNGEARSQAVYPWYRFLFSVPPEMEKQALKTHIDAALELEAVAEVDDIGSLTRALGATSLALKARHESATSASVEE